MCAHLCVRSVCLAVPPNTTCRREAAFRVCLLPLLWCLIVSPRWTNAWANEWRNKYIKGGHMRPWVSSSMIQVFIKNRFLIYVSTLRYCTCFEYLFMPRNLQDWRRGASFEKRTRIIITIVLKIWNHYYMQYTSLFEVNFPVIPCGVPVLKIQLPLGSVEGIFKLKY